MIFKKINIFLIAAAVAFVITAITMPSSFTQAYTNNATLKASASTYVVNATNGTILVSAHDIYWQITPRGGKQNWEGAEYYCENLTLGNSSAWNLPTPRALEDIANDTRNAVDEAPGELPVGLTQMDWDEGFYWTDTPGVAVQFKPVYDITKTTKDNYFNVRCFND